MAGIAAFYFISAAAGAIADRIYAVIALLAALIPASAALLLFATMRSKTAAGGPEDESTKDDGVPGSAWTPRRRSETRRSTPTPNASLSRTCGSNAGDWA